MDFGGDDIGAFDKDAKLMRIEVPLCFQHSYQPAILLLAVVGVLGSIASIYSALKPPLSAAVKDVSRLCHTAFLQSEVVSVLRRRNHG